jgi:HK97 gp10 family phage protein
MPRTTMRIENAGFRDLNDALKQFSSAATQRNLVLRALKPAAEAIADMARARVPVDEGRLRDAIEVEVKQPRPKRRKGYFSVAIWVRETSDYRKLKNPLPKSRHTRRARFRDYAIGSIPYVYSRFIEFGTRHIVARPFMRPAWDAEGGQKAIDRIRDAMRLEIDKAVARQVRKAARAARGRR